MSEQEWQEWLASRPPIVQELAVKLPPDKLYRIKATGQRCRIYSYFENGTVRVLVRDRIAAPYCVFGYSYKPEDLEEVG